MGGDGLSQSATAGFVASKRHTGTLLLLLLSIVLAGVVLPRLTGTSAEPEPGGRLRTYIQIVAIQWSLFWYVRVGLHRAGRTVRQLIDEFPRSAARWGLYLAIAVAGWVLWTVVGFVLAAVLRLGVEDLRTLQLLLPHTPFEKTCWVVVSLTAGFCEEILYRGYLQKQLGAMTGSLAAGILLQAALFGVAHAVLPLKLVVSVTLLALLLGGMAAWRKSLVPGMILHTAIGIAGLFSAG